MIGYNNGHPRRVRQGVHPAGDGVPPKQSSWRDRLLVHPAADLFPPMSKDELRALADDIQKNGLQEPAAVYYDGNTNTRFLLDGRNRLDALELLGLDTADLAWTTAVQTKDPFAYVISKNIHRRHLTSEQKRELLANLLKADPEKSNVQIAKTAHVNDKTVAKVRRDLESTSEIPRLKRTKGKDGRARPVRHKTAGDKPPPISLAAGADAAAPERINLDRLKKSWKEIEAHAGGNQTRLKDALRNLLKELQHVLGIPSGGER